MVQGRAGGAGLRASYVGVCGGAGRGGSRAPRHAWKRQGWRRLRGAARLAHSQAVGCGQRDGRVAALVSGIKGGGIRGPAAFGGRCGERGGQTWELLLLLRDVWC